jgi:hypothetical protein
MPGGPGRRDRHSVDQQERTFGRFEQIMARHDGSGFGLGLWI